MLVEEKVGKDYKGIVFPGGHIENGEPIVDSIIREIYEETGLTVSNLELCGVKDWVKEDGNRYIERIHIPGQFNHHPKAISFGCH